MDAAWVGGVKSTALPPTAVGGGAAGNATPATTPVAVRAPGLINQARHAASTNTTIPVQRTVPFTVHGQPPRCDNLSAGDVVFVGGRHSGAAIELLRNPNPNNCEGFQYTHCADFGYLCNEYFCNASGSKTTVARDARLQRVPPSPQIGEKGIAEQTIRLHDVKAAVLSKGLVLSNALTHASSVLRVLDVTFMHVALLNERRIQMLKGDRSTKRHDKEREVVMDMAVKATPKFQWQGVLPMDESPFLRGCGGIDNPGVALLEFHGPYRAEAGVASRHAGDDAAFDAFDEELQRIGVFNWTPDGILLSRDGESADALEGDVKHPLPGHLLNIAVQGAAHTISWTPDLLDLDGADAACQSGDEVFIAVIGDVSWELNESGEDGAEGTSTELQQQLFEHLASAHTKHGPHGGYVKPGKRARDSVDGNNEHGKDVNASVAQLEKALKDSYESTHRAHKGHTKIDKDQAAPQPQDESKDLASMGKKLRDAKTNLRKKLSDANAPSSEINKARIAVEGALSALYGKSWTKKDEEEAKAKSPSERAETPHWQTLLDTYRTVQRKVREGGSTVKSAQVSNFRLARVTSAQLAAHSRFDPRDPASRCGLHLKPPPTEDPESVTNGCGEYILGAWRVGVVLDSAAGGMNRLLPTLGPKRCSMLRIHVDVQWVNSLQLWRKFASYWSETGRAQSRSVVSTVERNSTIQAEPMEDGSSEKQPSTNRAEPPFADIVAHNSTVWPDLRQHKTFVKEQGSSAIEDGSSTFRPPKQIARFAGPALD